MSEWNAKKDILWGLALTLGLIVLFEMYKYFQARQTAASNASSATSAASTEAAQGSGLASAIQNLGNSYGSAGSQGTTPAPTQSNVPTNDVTGGNTYISPGAQIGALSQDAINALLDNSQTVKNPIPIAPIQSGSQPKSAAQIVGLPATPGTASATSLQPIHPATGGQTVGNPEVSSPTTNPTLTPSSGATPTHALVQHTSMVQ